ALGRGRFRRNQATDAGRTRALRGPRCDPLQPRLRRGAARGGRRSAGPPRRRGRRGAAARGQRARGRRPRPDPGRPAVPGVELYWLPLGAGGHFVRLNGRAYEAYAAWRGRRPRADLYHSALVVDGHVIEMAPIPRDGGDRGVVCEGAVGSG